MAEANALWSLSHFTTSHSDYDAARRAAEHAGTWYVAPTRLVDAYLHVIEGRPDEAEHIIIEIGPQIRLGIPAMAGWMDIVEAWLLLHRGHTELARRLLEERDGSPGASLVVWAASQAAVWGWLEWEEGRLQEASAHLGRCAAACRAGAYHVMVHLNDAASTHPLAGLQSSQACQWRAQMIDSAAVRAGMVTVNGTDIYHEVRGAGDSVMLIPGATGDAGHFTRLAELLATEFTVATYDRRGNSRSPAPVGWTSTSVDEQADDLAALIEALELAPAALYGTSGGAIIGLDTVLRHERLLRGAILHEPPLISVTAQPDEAMAHIQPIIEKGMASGGPRGALEAFLGFAAGDSLQDLDAATVERMLGNAQVLFGLKFGVFEGWRPDEAALGAVAIPVQVMRGTELAAPFFGEAAACIAMHLGTAVVTAPGRHTPNFDRPAEPAEAVRPFLHELTIGRRR